LSKEVIFKQDLERLAGPRPFDVQNAEIPAVPIPESANNPTNQEA